MKIGNIEDGFFLEKVRKLLNIGKITENECKHCWNINFCGICSEFADGMDQFSSKIKLEKCSYSCKSTEDMIKNYCMLKEFGYDFEKENLVYDYIPRR